jgi:AP-1 complex subunit gamma-1
LIKERNDLILLQEGLIQASFWCLGEYGDICVSGNEPKGEFGIMEEEGEDNQIHTAPTEQEVVDVIVSILKGPFATPDIREYGITALVKLSVRCKQQNVQK